MDFCKYSGAGNDFVLTADEWGRSDAEAGSVARRVCGRATGVGVDGLVLVRRLGADRIAVRFFNPDGSAFSTCGNGTRCAARFAVDRGIVESPRFVIETPAAEIEATCQDESVELTYRIAVSIDGEHEVQGPEGRAAGWLVRIGVPHFVLPVSRYPEEEIEEVCRPIRHLPALGSEGANVNLVYLESRRAGRIRTFERGVEGETLACGSGAMASAIALCAAGRSDPSLSLTVRGGQVLRVSLPAGGHVLDGLTEVRLAGPATYIFAGTLAIPSGTA